MTKTTEPEIIDCIDIEGLFSDYYDGDASIEKHLQTCPRCMQKYKNYQQLLQSLPDIEKPALPPDLYKNMLQYVHENKDKPQQNISPLIQSTAKKEQHIATKIATLAVTVAAIAAVFMFVFSQIPSGSLPGSNLMPEARFAHTEEIPPEEIWWDGDPIPITNLSQAYNGDVVFAQPAVQDISANNLTLTIGVTAVVVIFLGAIILVVGRSRQ